MTGTPISRRRLLQIGTLSLPIAALSACGKNSPSAGNTLSSEVASFDVVAGPIPRLMVGLSDKDGNVVTGGSVTFRLRSTALGVNGQWSSEVPAQYLEIPGRPTSTRTIPTIGAPSEGVGVYSTGPVTIPGPGFWEVEVDAGKLGKTTTAFLAQNRAMAASVGQQAPLTKNPTVDTPNVSPAQLDSSAAGSTALSDLPYPMLHQHEIASSIAARRSLVVAVVTPAYCTSKFCGPLRDEVAKLASRRSGVADFVHLEVFDSDRGQVSAWASEWIASKDSPNDANEPWLFLVNADGVITHRWDNVVPMAEVEAALDKL